MVSPHMVSVAIASSVQISRSGRGPSSLNGFYLVRGPGLKVRSMVCFSQGNVRNVYLQYFDKCKIRNYIFCKLTESTMKGAPDSSSVMTACVRPEAAAWRSLSARSASRPESGGWVMVIPRATCHVSRVTSPPPHMSRVTRLLLRKHPGSENITFY